MNARWVAVAELVDAWEPGVVIVEDDDVTAVGVAQLVDGVLVVDVAELASPVAA